MAAEDEEPAGRWLSNINVVSWTSHTLPLLPTFRVRADAYRFHVTFFSPSRPCATGEKIEKLSRASRSTATRTGWKYRRENWTRTTHDKPLQIQGNSTIDDIFLNEFRVDVYFHFSFNFTQILVTVVNFDYAIRSEKRVEFSRAGSQRLSTSTTLTPWLFICLATEEKSLQPR